MESSATNTSFYILLPSCIESACPNFLESRGPKVPGSGLPMVIGWEQREDRRNHPGGRVGSHRNSLNKESQRSNQGGCAAMDAEEGELWWGSQQALGIGANKNDIKNECWRPSWMGLHSHQCIIKGFMKVTKSIWTLLNVVPLILGNPSHLSLLTVESSSASFCNSWWFLLVYLKPVSAWYSPCYEFAFTVC